MLEVARQHDGNYVTVVLLFERAIVRAGRTDYVGHGPAFAARENARHGLARSAVLAMVRQRAIQFDRNFCQDLISTCVL